MKSSATPAIRAIIMLACVVGIPVWALSNQSWPAVVEKFKNINFAALWPGDRQSPPSLPSASHAAGPDVNQFAAAGKPQPPRDALNDDIPLGPQGINEVQHRLQALGAQYYLLETWGNNQELYHFYCIMAATDGGNLTRYFEAVESEPLWAMVSVLRQVVDWRRQTGGADVNVAGR